MFMYSIWHSVLTTPLWQHGMVLVEVLDVVVFCGSRTPTFRKARWKVGGKWYLFSRPSKRKQKLRKRRRCTHQPWHPNSPATKTTSCTRHKPLRFDEEGLQSRVDFIWSFLGPCPKRTSKKDHLSSPITTTHPSTTASISTAQPQNVRHVFGISLSN